MSVAEKAVLEEVEKIKEQLNDEYRGTESNIMVYNEISATPWNTMDTGNAMEYHETSWNPAEYHGISWRGLPWNIVEYHQVSWNTLEYEGIP